jgi:hypothetical protein
MPVEMLTYAALSERPRLLTGSRSGAGKAIAAAKAARERWQGSRGR